MRPEVLREEMFLVDAGLGTARMSMQDEPKGVPINRATRFENKVGSLDLVASESLIKERAAARFNDLVGSTDVVAGEPLLLLPRRFTQNRAWMELNKIWRTGQILIDKVKGGYSVAIAGFITFIPFCLLEGYRMINSPLRALSPKGRILWCSNSRCQFTTLILRKQEF